MTTLFNILSGLTGLGVLVCFIFVRRLRTYVASPSWRLKEWAFVCFLLAQLGGLINIAWLDPGLNWLGLLNTGLRLGGICLLALSYAEQEKIFKTLFKKLRIKATPVWVDKAH